MNIDQAVEQAFKFRNGPIEHQEEVREALLTEIERLEELTSFEARFTVPILQGLADDLYQPNLANAMVGG